MSDQLAALKKMYDLAYRDGQDGIWCQDVRVDDVVIGLQLDEPLSHTPELTWEQYRDAYLPSGD